MTHTEIIYPPNNLLNFRFRDCQILNLVTRRQSSDYFRSGQRISVKCEPDTVLLTSGQIHTLKLNIGVRLRQIYNEHTGFAVLFLQGINPAVIDDFATVNDNESLTYLFDIVEVVSRQDYRDLTFSVYLLEELANQFFGNHIQADGRLIQYRISGLCSSAAVRSHRIR